MDTLITLLLIVFGLSKLFAKNKKAPTRAPKRFSDIEKKLDAMFGMENGSSDSWKVTPGTSFGQKTVEKVYVEGQSHHNYERSQSVDASLEGKSRYGTARTGSLEDFSTEGMDFCDPSLGHDDHSTGCEPHAAMKPLDDFNESGTSSIDLNWNSENLVRAVIMNEILTRPSERFVRRG